VIDAALTSFAAGSCELRPSQRFKLLLDLLAPGFVAGPELAPNRDAGVGQRLDQFAALFDKAIKNALLRTFRVRNEPVLYKRDEGDALVDGFVQLVVEGLGMVRWPGL